MNRGSPWSRDLTQELTLYGPVVTVCTASLTFNISAFCPHSVFMCFVWIWEQTAIISLYSINWLVCIIEMECVYCAVRTGSLYTIPVSVILHSATTLCYVPSPISTHVTCSRNFANRTAYSRGSPPYSQWYRAVWQVAHNKSRIYINSKNDHN